MARSVVYYACRRDGGGDDGNYGLRRQDTTACGKGRRGVRRKVLQGLKRVRETWSAVELDVPNWIDERYCGPKRGADLLDDSL